MTDIRYPYQGVVASTDGEGLVIDPITGELTLVLDGTSLSKSSSGLKWNDASTQFIDVSSSSTAFRVTQRGTGAALLVEDSTNPDASPFVIDASGRVAIGATSTTSKLLITENSSYPAVRITQAGTGLCLLVEDAASPDSSPFAIDADGRVGIGTNAPISRLSVLDDSTDPALFINQLGAGAALLVEDSTNPDNTPFIIDNNGNVGIGTLTPTRKLDVIGSIQASQEVQAGTGVRTSSVFNTNSFLNARLLLENTGATIQRDVADANPALIVRHANAGSTGDILRLGNSASTVFTVRNSGNVGINSTSPTSALHLGQVASSAEAATCLLDEKDTTPASPTSGTQVKMYMKADKIIFQYNDGGTVRYKYLDLTGTTDTWTATTTAP